MTQWCRPPPLCPIAFTADPACRSISAISALSALAAICNAVSPCISVSVRSIPRSITAFTSGLLLTATGSNNATPGKIGLSSRGCDVIVRSIIQDSHPGKKFRKRYDCLYPTTHVGTDRQSITIMPIFLAHAQCRAVLPSASWIFTSISSNSANISA